MFKPNKNQILIGVAALAIIITGVLVFANSNPGSGNVLSALGIGISKETVAKKSIDYLNTSVLQEGQTASLDSVSLESGVIKMKIKITTESGSNVYDSYATRDGKLLFPEAFTLETVINEAVKNTENTENTTQVTPASVEKVDNTMLDAYVVSGCPFGIQIQRALAGAVKSAPSLAQYVNVRYIGGISGNTITAMHGTEEAQENLRQICIREEQQSKYWNYVGCYIKKAAGTASNGMPFGDTKACQAEAGVDATKLNACVTGTARGLAYAKKDFDLNAKYNIKGSPTLVLNGQVISETPFGGRSANAIGQLICSSSITPPSFCQDAQLPTDQASTSFSLTYAGSDATGATANCAPTVQ